MKASTAGKILAALAFASMIGGLSMGTALADDRGWRDNRGWHERNWRDNHGGWRDNRGRWHEYQPVYAPPPVVYAPPPSPGIHLFFPLFR